MKVQRFIKPGRVFDWFSVHRDRGHPTVVAFLLLERKKYYYTRATVNRCTILQDEETKI